MGSNEFTGALEPGYKLLEYEIVRVLGRPGGFGVTYLATDIHLGKLVAIKEYLPIDYAVRGEGHSVSLRSQSDSEAFEWGRSAFIREARVLARFKHPNVVGVHRFFEANGTAYIVMEYVQGRTLTEFLAQEGRLDEQAVRNLLLPILEGLEHVHAAGVLHRDVKPDNIIITGTGIPVLIDFGAARNDLGSRSRSAMVFTAGYAPLEQYSDNGAQGPWTDIYALGAVAYRIVVGIKPLDAIARLSGGRMTCATEAGAGRYSPEFLDAIDWSVELKAADRPQNIATWRSTLLGLSDRYSAALGVAPDVDFDPTRVEFDAPRGNAFPGASLAANHPDSDLTVVAPKRASQVEPATEYRPSVSRGEPLRAERRTPVKRHPDPVGGLARWRALPLGARVAVLAVGVLVVVILAAIGIRGGRQEETKSVPPTADAGPATGPVATAPAPALEPVTPPSEPVPRPGPERAPVAEPEATPPPVARNEPAHTPAAPAPARPSTDEGKATVPKPAPTPAREEPKPARAPAEATPPVVASAPAAPAQALYEHLEGPWRAKNVTIANLSGSECKAVIDRVWDLKFDRVSADGRHLEGSFVVDSTIRAEVVDRCPPFKSKVTERGTFASANERNGALLLLVDSQGCAGEGCDKVRDLPTYRGGRSEASVNFSVPPRSLRFSREGEDVLFQR